MRRVALLSICALVIGLGAPGGLARAERRLSLAEAVTLARHERSEMTQAEIDIQRARLQRLVAWLARVHLTIQGQVTEQYQNVINAPNMYCDANPQCLTEGHPFSASAQLAIPVWSGLAVEANIARAHSLEDAARAQRGTIANELGLEVANAYWGVRRAELQHQVAANAMKRDQDSEQFIKSHVDSGIAPLVDYNRAHALVLRDQAQLLLLDAQLAEARAQLALSLQIDDTIVLTEDPDAHAPVVPPLDAAIAAASTARPEFAAQKALIQADEQAVRAAAGAFWPQISLVGQLTFQNSLLYNQGHYDEPVIGNLTLGAMASWTIFDSLSTYTAMRDAKLVRDRAKQDLVRTRFRISEQVQVAHIQLVKAMERRAPLEKAALLSRDTLDMLRKRYRVGNAILIELLQAQGELLQAESDLVESKIGIAQAEALLKNALGTL